MSDRKVITGIVIGVFLAVLVVALLPIFVGGVTNDAGRINKRIDRLGTYGDMFGMLNPIFSGLALTGAIYAVILQHRDQTGRSKDKMKEERERRWTAELNAKNFLVQNLSHEFENSREAVMQEFNRAYAKVMHKDNRDFRMQWSDYAEDEKQAVKYTVRGKMMRYRYDLEIILEKINEDASPGT